MFIKNDVYARCGEASEIWLAVMANDELRGFLAAFFRRFMEMRDL
jgi:hypothetical protein